MTNEELLKSHILSEYKSVREFCLANDFAYSTVSSIFRRGILGSSVSLMLKICDRLSIDIEELVKGKIVVLSSEDAPAVKITALYLRLDAEDRGRAEGFIEGLLSGDKYEDKKEKRA